MKKHLIRLLSGSIIPIWFFPDWLADILNLLPFVYIYQLPLDIYIGSATNDEICRRILNQRLTNTGVRAHSSDGCATDISPVFIYK